MRGGTVLEVTVEALRRGGLSPLVVVLESDSPCRRLPGLADAWLLENPDPSRGMLSSIRIALEQLALHRPALDAAAIQPGDHPFAPAEAIAALVARYALDRPALLRPRYPDRAGHPLFVSAALWEAARACDDAIGLRQLVRERAAELVELDLPHEGADDDIDRPEDLARLAREDDGRDTD